MRISPWCSAFGYEVVAAENTPTINVFPAAPTIFRLKDLFTTREGLWDSPPDPGYEIGWVPKWAIDDYYRPKVFTACGAADHFFMLLIGLDGKPVLSTQFASWSDGFDKYSAWNGAPPKPDWLTISNSQPEQGGWANQGPLMHAGSGYDYNTTKGPWCIAKAPGRSDVVRYAGLPGSLHIATFAVFQETDADDVPVEPPPPAVDDAILTRIADALERQASALEAFNQYIGVPK